MAWIAGVGGASNRGSNAGPRRSGRIGTGPTPTWWVWTSVQPSEPAITIATHATTATASGTVASKTYSPLTITRWVQVSYSTSAVTANSPVASRLKPACWRPALRAREPRGSDSRSTAPGIAAITAVATPARLATIAKRYQNASRVPMYTSSVTMVAV